MIVHNAVTQFDGKKIGQRIKACRVLSGLSQDEFVRKHSISLQSLKTWELGVVPRSEGSAKLIEAFRNDGVFVNSEWLIFGIGTGPSFNLEDVSDAKQYEDIRELFIRECQKNSGNPIAVDIEDNDMKPLFNRGDLVLGNLIMPESLLADKAVLDSTALFLVKLPSGKFAPRWLHIHNDLVFARSNLSANLVHIPSPTLARILWHRRS